MSVCAGHEVLLHHNWQKRCVHAWCAIADSKIGTAWGVVAAVVGPTIAVATRFLLTWYYRSEKKIIINEVIRRLKVSDICKIDSAVQYTSAGASNASQARQARRSSAFHSEEFERDPS